MIENYLLEYLVSFEENKTLSKTASKLNVSTATISRGLQKLEKQVGVKLFIRKPQRILFTPAGENAVKLAKKILKDQNDFIPAIQNFAQKEIIVASTIPSPLLLLKNKFRNNSEYIFTSTPLKKGKALSSLLSHQADVIFTTTKVNNEQVKSLPIAQEKLFIKITKYNPLYNQKTVNFSDLNTHEFIVFNDIGIWKEIINDKIPHATFLYQNDPETFNELVKKSNFPIFRTNLSLKLEQTKKLQDHKRKLISINDPEAQQTIYAIFRVEDSYKLSRFLSTAKEVLH
ncbi:MAG: LysR family transcriptional regulator [Lactobacillus sp.]|uniref:LysR family transcriptional regulator n=1 Tax=Lactobacillus sp. TaxID=1591 RepID=UPI0023C0CB16|nr:LysR family transcriptional regulator [Lactobacillus sp.]MDE7050235.1 LysR family transcriptional regulator [Lactobacillus sp.]